MRNATYNYGSISRVLRTQSYSNPNLTPHFTVLSLVSCGRDIGDFSFEKEELLKHISLSRIACKEIFGLNNIYVEVIPCKEYDEESSLITSVTSYIASKQADVEIQITEPDIENNYYYGFRIKIKAEIKTTVYEIGDGGMLDWTQKLLSNKMERMMITGIGFQMLHQLTQTPKDF